MFRKIRCSVFFLFIFQQASACPFCNPQISEAIFDDRFMPNVITILTAFVVLGVVVAILSVMTTKYHKKLTTKYPDHRLLTPVPLLTASTIIGIGGGGFIDGIFLHQVLQWHEMLSARIPMTDYIGKSVNMFWDGVFHTGTLIITLIGIVLFWRLLHRNDINRSGYLFSGGLLAGWGIFNLVEGTIDHQILKLHNVKEFSDDVEAWNWSFLGLAVVLLVVGGLIASKSLSAGKVIRQ